MENNFYPKRHSFVSTASENRSFCRLEKTECIVPWRYSELILQLRPHDLGSPVSNPEYQAKDYSYLDNLKQFREQRSLLYLLRRTSNSPASHTLYCVFCFPQACSMKSASKYCWLSAIYLGLSRPFLSIIQQGFLCHAAETCKFS